MTSRRLLVIAGVVVVVAVPIAAGAVDGSVRRMKAESATAQAVSSATASTHATRVALASSATAVARTDAQHFAWVDATEGAIAPTATAFPRSTWVPACGVSGYDCSVVVSLTPNVDQSRPVPPGATVSLTGTFTVDGTPIQGALMDITMYMGNHPLDCIQETNANGQATCRAKVFKVPASQEGIGNADVVGIVNVHYNDVTYGNPDPPVAIKVR